MDGSSVEALVSAAQRGEPDAFNRLVERYQDVVFASAYGLLGDAHLAQDVAQEVFVQVYRDLRTLREPVAFPGWLRRIVFKFSDRATRAKRVFTVPIDSALAAADMAPDPSIVVERRELQATVQAEIERLSERDRVLVSLFYGAGHAQHDIAAYLELPPTTVKKRLHDARRRLKERLMVSYVEDLNAQRPSRDEQFLRKVQFLVAVRSGDVKAVARQLTADPTLVRATLSRAEWAKPEMGQPTLPMEFDYTPLHFAAKYGLLELAGVLLANGAAVDDTTPGYTPLHAATLTNNVAMVHALLEAGADPNRATVQGLTPLHRAAMRGYVETAQTLAERGADPTVRDAGGRTPLDWAVQLGETDADGPLGRVLDARGAPLDGLGPLSTLRAGAPGVVLETGIKVLDVFAPLMRGGTIHFRAGGGVGLLVLLAELACRLARRGGRTVYVGWRERYYAATDPIYDLREMGVGTSTIVLGTLNGRSSRAPEALLTGLSVAGEWRAQGRDVLVIVDQPPGGMPWLEGLRPQVGPTDRGSVTLLAYQLDLPNWERTASSETRAEWDTWVELDVAIGKSGVYPAVDPLTSGSRLFDPGVLSAEHVRVAQQVRARMQSTETEAERQLARRLQLFGSQPFFVAEPWNAKPGAYVTLADSLASYAALLDGAYTDVPDQQLLYIGALE